MQHKLFRLFFVLILVTGLTMMSTPPPARAAGPWYVSTTGNDANDCMSPAAPCATINGAIGKATAGDTINVAVGTYTGTGSEVVLIDKDTTLSGGWDGTFTTQSDVSTIDGQGARRGITANTGVTASIENFTVQNGNVTGNGGGVLNAGNLTINNSSISNNIAGNGTGSAIYNMNSGVLNLNYSSVDHNGSSAICFVIANEGTFTANNSVIEANITTTLYCASIIVVNFSGNMTMSQTAVRNNPTGGGVYNYATLTLNNSLVSGNVGTDASGGIYSWGGILTANNTTISGNTTSNGGGIFLGGGGSARLNNDTISNNTANNMGGGIYNLPNSPADVLLQNTLLAGNTALNMGPDCNGNLGSAGYNLIGDISNCNFTAATGDVINQDPALGPLQDNGGITFTHALLPQSAAIDSGNNIGCTDQDGNLLTSDQRGMTRPQGIACDIGAYEYIFTTPGPATSIAIVSGSGQQTTLNQAFSKPLRVVALDSQGNRVSGVTVNFTAPASGVSGTFADTGNNTTSVITDAGGVATTSTFTANDQTGAYTVSASAVGLGTVDFNLEQAFHPANDNFANAEAITSVPFNATVDITEATNESDEPQNCYSMPNTVWYSFTPTETILVRADTQGSIISNNLNVYKASGSGIFGLNLVPSGCTAYYGPVTFLAEAGQTYYLQAGGINGEVGTVKVNLEQIPPPSNDDFANATSINSLPSTIDFNTTIATFQSGEPNPSCTYSAPPYKTVWYSFTASQDGSISASIPSFNFYPFVAAYSGSGFNNLTQLGCGQYANKITFHVVHGQTYYFQVGGLNGDGGSGQFLLEATPPPQANFYTNPWDPSKYDTVQFQDNSYDPGNIGFQTYTWNFGDGTTAAGYSAPHKYAADGDYQVVHTVTTTDGRTATITQTVQIRTHDVAITKIATPASANVGQTKTITITLRNIAYPETVQIDLYKSTPNGFAWVATITKAVPALSGNRTTAVNFSYTFTSDDAKLGKVTFKAVATIIGARDAYPSDNEAISSITKVAK